MGSWANSNKTQYQWDTLGRQTYEERFDYVLGNWVNRYDITQAYDKNGNRTGYDKNVAGGYTSSYGKAYNLSYTFDNVNSISSISDADDANYSCTVTSDQNLNITQITEHDTRTGGATLYTYFDYDDLNRLTAHRTKRAPFAGVTSWLWSKRSHQYDATGRLVKSNYKTWVDGQQEPSGDTLEHVYAGAKHVQNYDGTNYGAVWHWAGAANEHMGPLASPNADTASQKGYNQSIGGSDVAAGGPAGGAGGMEPQRRTFQNPTTEGDQRYLFGQGRPMAKASSGNGANWYQGTTSQRTGMSGYAVESRLMFEGTVSSTDMSRATDGREKDRIGIFGTGLSYAGSYARVTSESIGRDLNPLGRGAGQALVGGTSVLGFIEARLPNGLTHYGEGNSINNCRQNGGSDNCGLSAPNAPEFAAESKTEGHASVRELIRPLSMEEIDNSPCQGKTYDAYMRDKFQCEHIYYDTGRSAYLKYAAEFIAISAIVAAIATALLEVLSGNVFDINEKLRKQLLHIVPWSLGAIGGVIGVISYFACMWECDRYEPGTPEYISCQNACKRAALNAPATAIHDTIALLNRLVCIWICKLHKIQWDYDREVYNSRNLSIICYDHVCWNYPQCCKDYDMPALLDVPYLIGDNPYPRCLDNCNSPRSITKNPIMHPYTQHTNPIPSPFPPKQM